MRFRLSPGPRSFTGRGLHLCAYCDGWEFRDKTLAAFGQGACCSEAARPSRMSDSVPRRRKAIFEERYFPDCGPFPMARELVQRMRGDALKVLVATSASKSELHELLRAAGVDDLIEVAATSSDATRSKPDPDIVHAAVERSALPPGELLMLGDTGAADTRLVSPARTARRPSSEHPTRRRNGCQEHAGDLLGDRDAAHPELHRGAAICSMIDGRRSSRPVEGIA